MPARTSGSTVSGSEGRPQLSETLLAVPQAEADAVRVFPMAELPGIHRNGMEGNRERSTTRPPRRLWQHAVRPASTRSRRGPVVLINFGQIEGYSSNSGFGTGE